LPVGTVQEDRGQRRFIGLYSQLPDEFFNLRHCVTKRRFSMPQAKVVMDVRRVNPTTSIIDIKGEVSAFAEDVLMQA
jgi:hypothetical protein